MIFARPNFLTAFLFVAAARQASAAELERVEARFEIFGFAGLHVLTNRTTVQERGDRYAIAPDLETRGLASVFVDLTSYPEESPLLQQPVGLSGAPRGCRRKAPHFGGGVRVAGDVRTGVQAANRDSFARSL